MKRILVSVLSLGLLASCTAAPAYADILSQLQGAALSDVKQAEAIYAANPQVPTAPAATQCLGWMDVTLSSPNAPITLNLAVPKGVISGIADLDVALSVAGTNNMTPLVDAFNKNCGWYVEDLKAQAAVHAGGLGLNIFGLKL